MSALSTTLPASWYTSLPLYELERRAVFSKSWYLLGPVTRFINAGEKVPFEVAQVGFKLVPPMSRKVADIFVVNDQNRTLRTHTTATGLLFTTISAEAPPFEEFFPGLERLLATVDFTKLPYRRSITYEGNFNWKTMVDGYQECLHCQYTHPSFSILYPPTSYAVHNHTNFSQHIADPSKPDDGLFLYFFPNCTLNVYGGGMSSFRVCPTEKPGVTRMEFDYYFLENADGKGERGQTFNDYYQFVRQVALEDLELCEKAQGNLQTGVYHRGILNPIKETGVAYFQQRVLDLVSAQFEQETDPSRRYRKDGAQCKGDIIQSAGIALVQG